MTKQPMADEVEERVADAPEPVSNLGVPLWSALGILLGLFGQVAFFSGFYIMKDGRPDYYDEAFPPALRMLLHSVPVLVILFSDNEFGRQFKPAAAHFLRRMGKIWFLLICLLALIAGSGGWRPQWWPVYAVFMAWGLVSCWRVK